MLPYTFCFIIMSTKNNPTSLHIPTQRQIAIIPNFRGVLSKDGMGYTTY